MVVVENLNDVGRAETTKVQEPVETTHVYPLLRGRDVRPWLAVTRHWVLLPQEPQNPAHAVGEDDLRSSCPHTHYYLSLFEDRLRKRPGFLKYFDQKTAPFYATYNVGPYTFAPHKVVWREQAASLTAAVVSSRDDRIVIPDHKLMLSPFDLAEEAHFVCACLNNTIAQFLVKAYAVETSISTHLFGHLSVPRYEPNNRLHRSLSRASQRAHDAASKNDTERVAEIEAEVDELAAKLWGLSAPEMRSLCFSLDEALGRTEPRLPFYGSSRSGADSN